ncbi:MAG: DUF5011 domain-containing protein [Candidatus Gribaldobacteria bacterium]|nr:DUF5011 domain-containing protein [Candidatus Gribaldobacteria bacterium]
MQAKRNKWLLIVGGLAVFLFSVAIFSDGQIAQATAPQCSDGIDNDGYGDIDIADPNCHTDANRYNFGSYDPNINVEYGEACFWTCYYDPKPGRIIVEFDHTNKIKSNGTIEESRTPVASTNIPAGYYNISMFSVDGYASRPYDAPQPREIWRMLLTGNSESTIETTSTRDMADKYTCIGQTHDDLETNFFVAEDVNSAIAQHAAYPDESSSNDLFPVCAAFDLINQSPDITLLGLSLITIDLNATFTDPGATSIDLEDGDLTSAITVTGTVNTSATGTYPILYTVVDSGGITATTTRIVSVIYTPPLPQCSDGLDNDGDETIDINDKTCHSDGFATNSISYLPNKDIENELPVITLIGTTSLEIFIGDTYTDQGATAFDFEDGYLTSSISATGSVNSQASGTYSIFYDLKDSQGASAQQKVRTVVVKAQPLSGCVVNCGGGAVIPQAIPLLGISNEKAEIMPNNSVLITWQTDASADSRVVYGASSVNSLVAASSNYGYATTTLTTNDLVLNHSLLINNLQSDIDYYFRPVSDNPFVEPAVGQELVLIAGGQLPLPIIPLTTAISSTTTVECDYLLEYLGIGLPNNPIEVRKLQRFLKEKQGFIDLEINGVFDQATLEAVDLFQMRYFTEILSPWGYGYSQPTGYVYITTKKKINELYCQRPFPLTSGQEDEITDTRNYLQALPQIIPSTSTPIIGRIETPQAEELAVGSNATASPVAVVQTTTSIPLSISPASSTLIAVNIPNISSINSLGEANTSSPGTVSNQEEPSFLAGFIGRLANVTNVLLLIASLIAFLVVLAFVFIIIIVKKRRKQPEPYFSNNSASPLPMNFSVVDGLPTGIDKL